MHREYRRQCRTIRPETECCNSLCREQPTLGVARGGGVALAATLLTQLLERLFELEEPQRGVLEDALAALVDDLVGEAHQAAIAFRSEAMLDHLPFDMDRIADARGALHIQRCIQEREAGVLHCRKEKAFGEGVDERRRHCAALDGAP